MTVKSMRVLRGVLLGIGLFIILLKLSVIGWYDFSEVIPFAIGGGAFILAAYFVEQAMKKRINQAFGEDE